MEEKLAIGRRSPGRRGTKRGFGIGPEQAKGRQKKEKGHAEAEREPMT